ncbi:hypothetical protein HDV57DRAFT_505377 [Trichoderma longibrachiatum]
MVRSVSRSKGCARCLQRKVKCDEKLPQCSQCQRMRRPCPGPQTGSIFVHAVATERGPKAEKARARDSTAYQEILIAAAPRARQLHCAGKASALSPNAYQPSVAPVFDQLFLSSFITSFAKPTVGCEPHQSWMNHLHELLVTGDAPLKHSIRAVATAFHGRMAGNPAAQHAAEHCYIAALRSQRARIAPFLSLPSSRYGPNDEEIFTSMMLLYFELINPSSTASWLKHMHGVMSLLVLRGPKSCQTGAMHLLFRSLRFLEAYVSFRNRKASVFASEDWRTIPFTASGKSDIDRLIDILLLAPHLFSNKASDGSTSFSGSTVSVEHLSAELSVYSERYIQGILSAQESRQRMSGTPDESDEDDCNECSTWIDGGGDFCTSMPESLFYSAKIIIDYVAFGENAKAKEELLGAEQLLYSSLLFRIAELAKEGGELQVNVGTCVQLAFSLEVVESFGLSSACREQAQLHLKQLGWERVSTVA